MVQRRNFSLPTQILRVLFRFSALLFFFVIGEGARVFVRLVGGFLCRFVAGDVKDAGFEIY